MPCHHVIVTTGLTGVWCEDSRHLRVRFQSAPALYGPRHALRREAYQIVASDGSEHRIGAPEAVGITAPDDIIVPVDTAWPAGATLTVTAVGVEDTLGGLFAAPAAMPCRAIPEVRPTEVTAAGLLPREDLATDPATGGLVIVGGTWKHHFGRPQLVKVLERLLTDREPRGLGWEKGRPVTTSILTRFRARAREIVAAQEGVEAARVSVTFDRASGVLHISVAVRTPQGWETLEMEF